MGVNAHRKVLAEFLWWRYDTNVASEKGEDTRWIEKWLGFCDCKLRPWLLSITTSAATASLDVKVTWCLRDFLLPSIFVLFHTYAIVWLLDEPLNNVLILAFNSRKTTFTWSIAKNSRFIALKTSGSVLCPIENDGLKLAHRLKLRSEFSSEPSQNLEQFFVPPRTLEVARRGILLLRTSGKEKERSYIQGCD